MTRRSTLALGLLVAASVLHPALAAASTGPSVQKSGHAYFGDCAPQGVTMTVTVVNPVARRGVPIDVVASVTNVSPHPCLYQAGGPPMGGGQAGPVEMGPCGAMPMAVYRPAHHMVWPGFAAYSCPLRVGASLPPQGTVHVTGQWQQEAVLHRSVADQHLTQVSPGKYRLVVDGVFAFTIRVR
jgi:hypothetical protein